MTRPLLIADGDIPTTHILARILREAFGDVEVRTSDTLFGADVVGRPILVSRLCHPQFSWLPGYLRAHRADYVYFLDDNFFELTPDIDAHLAPFYAHPVVVATLGAFIGGASRTLVMSRRLREYLAHRFPDAAIDYLVPGFDVAGARRIDASTPRVAKPAGQIRIGYPTTRRTNVTDLLVPAIQGALTRHGSRVRFEFVGWAPDALIGVPGVDVHPNVADYDRYLAFKLSRGWDIGIAPLRGEPFETYKTNVKYREYGGCGIAGIYSRVPPYVDYVTDGENGLLVDNTVDAWSSALDRLIADDALRARIAASARQDVEANLDQRTSAAQLKAFLERRARVAA
jgi:glycosyltransferase involved in cell wall biosynthesis